MFNGKYWPTPLCDRLNTLVNEYVVLKHESKKSFLKKMKFWFYREFEFYFKKNKIKKDIDTAMDTYTNSINNVAETYNFIFIFIIFFYGFTRESHMHDPRINTLNDFFNATVLNPNEVDEFHMSTNLDEDFSQNVIAFLKEVNILIKAADFPFTDEENKKKYKGKRYKYRLNSNFERKEIEVSLIIYDCTDKSITKSASIIYNKIFKVSNGKLLSPSNHLTCTDKDVYDYTSLISLVYNLFLNAYDSIIATGFEILEQDQEL